MTGKSEPGILEAAGLVLERGEDFRLDVPSLGIGSDGCIGLIGPNGAGKTTLLNVLAGRLASSEGEVRVRGVPLREWGHERGLAVGLVRDELEGLSSLTVTEHLRLRGDLFAGWDEDYVQELTSVLEVPVRKRLSELSKGTKAKVGFVSVEAYRPPVLLLDEPTSGLDPAVRADFQGIIKRAVTSGPGRVLVFSTHLTEDIETLADRILVMRDGQIVGDTTVPPDASAESRRRAVEGSVGLLREHAHPGGEL